MAERLGSRHLGAWRGGISTFRATVFPYIRGHGIWRVNLWMDVGLPINNMLLIKMHTLFIISVITKKKSGADFFDFKKIFNSIIF